MKRILMGISAAALIASGAAAADAGKAKPDRGELMMPTAEGMKTAPPKAPPPGWSVVIFDNIQRAVSKVKYNCCHGFGIQGPHNGLGQHMLFDGVSFTPQSDLKVVEIDVPASYNAGTNAIDVVLYSDNSGVPGSAMKTWQFHNLPALGSCCSYLAATDPAGIPVVAGKKYWVVLRTDNTSLDALVTWNLNSVDLVHTQEFTQYCSNDAQGTPCTTPNDQWSTMTIQPPGLGLAVLAN